MAQRAGRYLIRWAAVILLILFAITFPSFLLVCLSPTDPATAYVKRDFVATTQEQIDEARVMLGPDRPLPVQYFDWVVDTLHTNFGTPLGTENSVMEGLAKVMSVTLTAVAYSAVITPLGALGAEMLGYLQRQRAGVTILSSLIMISISVPGFYLGIAFIDLFVTRPGQISVSGNGGFARYSPVVLCPPVLGICFCGQALTVSLEREMEQDYVTYLRCRGPKKRCILLFHASPHIVMDLLPSFVQMLGLCFANVTITERVFSLSGLDCLIINVVVKRGSPVIHVAALVLAPTLVLLDTAAELLQYGLRSDIRAAGGRV